MTLWISGTYLIDLIPLRPVMLMLDVVTTDPPKPSKHAFVFRQCRSPRSKEQIDSTGDFSFARTSIDRKDLMEAGELCVALLRPNSTSPTKKTRGRPPFSVMHPHPRVIQTALLTLIIDDAPLSCRKNNELRHFRFPTLTSCYVYRSLIILTNISLATSFAFHLF